MMLSYAFCNESVPQQKRFGHKTRLHKKYQRSVTLGNTVAAGKLEPARGMHSPVRQPRDIVFSVPQAD